MAHITKQIVCLAQSWKRGGFCYAGKELTGAASTGRWIRPVSSRDTEEISKKEGSYWFGMRPKLLDIIRIPFVECRPHLFQCENHIVGKARWKRKGAFSVKDLSRICDRPDNLWMCGNGGSSANGIHDRIYNHTRENITNSLYLITPTSLKFLIRYEEDNNNKQKQRIRAQFEYNGLEYLLSVTDPQVWIRCQRKRAGRYTVDNPENRIFMCISLALPYKDGACYKLAASIIGL